MKKIICLMLSLTFAFSIFAYNIPTNGENLLDLSSPRSLSGFATSTGSSIDLVNPESINTNPALTAEEQRVDLNFAYTGIFSTSSWNSTSYGNALQLGILIPFQWAVFTGITNLVISPFYEMHLGNSVNLNAGLSKEITKNLNVGISVEGGYKTGELLVGSDWRLTGNLGIIYKFGDLGFLKNSKVGFSVLNLGKNYSNTYVNLYPFVYKSGDFPTIGTFKTGFSSLLLSNDNVKLGFSVDVTTPLFQNFILDTGLQFSIKDIVYLTVSERFNYCEVMNGAKTYLPSVGLFIKFTLDVKNNDYFEDNGWSKNEMIISTAYKPLDSTLHAISAGVDVNLGTKDDVPPVIKIFDDDDE